MHITEMHVTQIVVSLTFFQHIPSILDSNCYSILGDILHKSLEKIQIVKCIDMKKNLQLLTFLYCTIFPTAWQFLNTSFTASKSSLMALAMSLVHKENLGTMSISLFVYLFIYLQCDREINQQGSGSPTASVRQAIWEVSQKFRHALVPLIIPHAHQPKNITSILSSAFKRKNWN